MAIVSVHWLQAQLSALIELSHHGQRLAPGVAHIQWRSRADRELFMAAIEAFTEAVGARDGVTACVVGHEGLVIAASGAPDETEGLAAVSQQCVAVARMATEDATLGAFQQTLVVGEERKVAMFWVGGMSIAIQAPTHVDLAAILAQAPINNDDSLALRPPSHPPKQGGVTGCPAPAGPGVQSLGGV